MTKEADSSYVVTMIPGEPDSGTIVEVVVDKISVSVLVKLLTGLIMDDPAGKTVTKTVSVAWAEQVVSTWLERKQLVIGHSPCGQRYRVTMHEDTQTINGIQMPSVDHGKGSWEGTLTQRVESELPTATSALRERPASHKCASCLSRRETRWCSCHNECAAAPDGRKRQNP